VSNDDGRGFALELRDDRAGAAQLRTLDVAGAGLVVRADDDGQAPRSIEGVAVPWDQIISVWGERERFERGAFGDFTGAGAALYVNHGHTRGELPIGRVVASEDRDQGQWFRAELADTERASEAYTLLRDGTLTGLSIGFVPVEVRTDTDELGSITTYTGAQFREVSVVGFPAYSDAAVTAVRQTTTTPPAPPAPTERHQMTPEELAALRAEMTALQTANQTLTRSVEMLRADGAGAGSPADPLPFASLAEFVRGLAVRSARSASFGEPVEAARQLAQASMRAHEQLLELRAYSGATTANLGTALQPAWLARDIRLVEANRDTLNLFSREALPADGMSVAYPKFDTKTGDVAVQANQGDDLAYLAMAITSDSAPVATYGGYSELSRQVIERAGLPFLAKVLRMQIISYAKITNGIIKARLTGATGTNTLTLPGAAAPSAVQIIGAGIDAAGLIEDNSVGLSAEFWLMSLAQFKSVALITDTTGRPIFELNGDGSNTAGTVRLDAIKSSALDAMGIKGVMPFKIDRKATGRYSYVCSSEALTVLESPGAPFNLEDENVVNLTKQFSLYGYLASTLNDPKGIVKVDHGATFA
jgi:HK97 family phage prohead protease